jgi:cold shock CspA family protein/ribosome-associated translation inhibitor RaiA
MEHSDAIEAMVRDKAAGLDKFARDIMSCRIVIEPATKRRHNGNLYEVRLDITLSGEEIAVTREPGQRDEYKDIQIALRDAFDAAKRKLEDYVRRRRGDVKVHEAPSHARIIRLFPVEGYGFLQTPDGREIYFHRNSVLHSEFDRLQIGTEVSFAEEPGMKGDQASTVKIVGRHNHH